MKQAFVPLPKTSMAIDEFTKADKAFRDEWDAFEEQNKHILDRLEQLREARNVALDAAKKELRAEADKLDYKTLRTAVAGPFEVQKKQSVGYDSEKFAVIAGELSVYQKLVEQRVLRAVYEVDQKAAERWLENNDLKPKFDHAYFTVDLTPSIRGPKAIPPLGAELKKE